MATQDGNTRAGQHIQSDAAMLWPLGRQCPTHAGGYDDKIGIAQLSRSSNSRTGIGNIKRLVGDKAVFFQLLYLFIEIATGLFQISGALVSIW